MDGGCEQEHEFEIVRCTGHQHIGSRCITMYNADNGDKICQSCPVYGTELGETYCEGAAHAIGPVRGGVIYPDVANRQDKQKSRAMQQDPQCPAPPCPAVPISTIAVCASCCVHSRQ